MQRMSRRSALRRKPVRALGLAALAALVAVGAALATSSRTAVAPSSNSAPTIAGDATVGSTLTANPGTWSGSAPLGFQYQWLLCNTSGASCSSIAGATQQTYALTSGNAGSTVRVQVIASNGDGSQTAQSAATATVTAATPLTSTSLPTITGADSVGSVLSANPGNWTGSSPIGYAYEWLSCNGSGASCNPIAGASSQTYTLQGADAGATLRVQVTATNPAGSATSQSTQTSPIVPASAAGCPTAPAGQTVAATAISPPARLQVATSGDSGTITAQTQGFLLTVHVTDTCGQPVSGAQVYATAVPYNQFSIPSTQVSDGSGNVTFTFQRGAGFPATRTQRLLVVFLRASRTGDPALAGISTTRLVSLPVSL